MAIGVSPQRLREVRFAEQWRGYRTEEVDAFVERVAEAFDAMELRLREAAERVAQAEQAASERASEDAVARTLVLAQRTADAAVREAEAEAARLITEAQERASAVVTEAEERAEKIRAELEARAAAEVHDLAERRRALESDVVLLRTYVRDHRASLVQEVREHLRWLESGEHLVAPPVNGPWTSTSSPVDEAPAAQRSPAGAGGRATEAPSVDALVALASRAEALRRRSPSNVPTGSVFGARDAPGGAASPGDQGADTDEPATGDASGPDDVGEGDAAAEPASAEVPVADIEEIPWREPSADDDSPSSSSPSPSASASTEQPSAAPEHEDPFIAELRRAVDDPEPLGPRDDDARWVDEADAIREAAIPSRFLRRRGRP